MNGEITDAEKVKPRLEAICRNIIDEKKWKPFNDISIEVNDFPAVIGAHITLQDWKISIMASPELYPAVEQLRREEELDIFFKQNDQEIAKESNKENTKENVKESTRNAPKIAGITTEMIIEKILYAVVVHEYGHYRWCPSTQEGLQRILSGVYDAIHKREYKKERIERLCFEIHNEVSDVILNTINARTDQQKEKYRDGLDLTYLLMSNYERRKNKRRHGKEFELFLHANLLLSDTHPQMFEKIKKYGPWFFFGKERYRRNIIDAFTQNRAVTEAVLDHHVTPEQSQYIVDRFKNVSNWYQIAHDYARIIHPFLNEPNHWLENSYSRKNDQHKSGKSSGNNRGSNSSNKSSGHPQEGKKDGENGRKSKDSGSSGSTKGDAKKSGSETKESEKDKQSNGNQGKDESEDAAKNDKPQNGNPGSNTDPNNDQNSDPNRKKHRPHPLQDYLDQLADAISRKPYSSPLLRAYPRLNQLYEHRAGKVALFAEQENRSGMFHELYAGKELLALDDFTLRRVAWSETQMYEGVDGLELELFQRSMPLRLEIESAMNPGGLPDFCFVVDSSSSMVFNPLKGEGSGDYHYAALSFYSILRYLKEMNLAYELRYNMINFSMTTVSSGWRSYREIEEVKRTLFDYQGSWTNLDPKALQKMRETREDSVICFMLSDTQFAMDNEEEIIHEVDQMLATGDMGFYLFQIGGPTTFCRALEDRGIQPTYIKSAQDFMNLSIRFTKNLYGRELHK